mgnify:FL=1
MKIEFHSSSHRSENYKIIYLIPSIGIVWDTQFKDDVIEKEIIIFKGEKILSFWFDWLWFGISIDLIFENKTNRKT